MGRHGPGMRGTAPAAAARADFAEGVRATAERRAPRFTGNDWGVRQRRRRACEPAAARAQCRIRMARPRRAVPRGHRGAGAPVRRARLLRPRGRAATLTRSTSFSPRSTRSRHRQEEALREMEGGRFFIARADEITFTTHLVIRSPLLRRFHRRPRCSPGCAPTSSGPTCASTGTRRCTRSRAPSRRSPGTRTTATRSSSRSST